MVLNVKKREVSIPLCEPKMGGNEWKYIKECLDTNWVSSIGKYVEQFEHGFADYLGMKYAVSCVNGTAALHIAFLVAGVKPEEEVIVPALSFVASANTVRYIGAWPVFIDVQADIWQLDPQKVLDFITKDCDFRRGKLINRKTKRTISAILPVHILGHPVDMSPILDLAKRFNLKVIEDATESLGAVYKKRKVGTLGDIACFSFNGNKIITTGGGGMLVTNNKVIAGKARYLTTQARDDSVEYIHNEIGYNYRLTNIQAAMGIAQMESLEKHIAIKRRLAQLYRAGLKDVAGITLPVNAPWAESIFWLYTILINAKAYGMNSRCLMHRLKARGIESRPLWYPLHRLKSFRSCYSYRVDVASLLYEQALSLPSSVSLTEEGQQRIIREIRRST